MFEHSESGVRACHFRKSLVTGRLDTNAIRPFPQPTSTLTSARYRQLQIVGVPLSRHRRARHRAL